MKKADTRHGAIVLFLLILIIASQLFYISYVFTCKKTGWHMDEIWSYGLSNSNHTPHLFDRFENGENNYYNKWVDGEVFHNYLTVQEDERFDYSSVYYNQTQDVHPPLYYFILHTICSFFPDTFSRSFAFSINVFSFIVSQVLLFLTARRLIRSDAAALAVCAGWGFTIAAADVFVFLRMYAFLLVPVMLLTYLHVRLQTDENPKLRLLLPLIFLTTFLGGLTHYYFFAFAAMLSLCTCISYLVGKKAKMIFIYGGGQLAAALLAVLSFPSIFSHITAGTDTGPGTWGDGKCSTIAHQIHFMLRYMLSPLFGIKISLIRSMLGTYILVALIALLVICAPLCFLFRKEKWFLRIALPISGFIKKLPSRLAGVWKKTDKSRFSALLSIIFAVLGVLTATVLTAPLKRMKELSSHYYCCVFPIVMLLALWLAYSICTAVFSRFSKNHGKARLLRTAVIYVLAAAAAVNSHISYEYQFIFDNGRNYETEIQEVVSNCDVIVFSGTGVTSDIQLFPIALSDCSKAFFTSTDEFDYDSPQINTAKSNDTPDILLIKKNGLFKKRGGSITDELVISNDAEEKTQESDSEPNDYIHEFADEFIANTDFDSYEYIGSDSLYEYTIMMYRIS